MGTGVTIHMIRITFLAFQGEGVETLKKVLPLLESLRLQVRQVRRRADISDLLLGPNSDLSGITKPIIMISNIIATAAGRLIVMPTGL